MSQDTYNQWYIETKKPLPEGIAQLLGDQISNAVVEKDAISFTTYGLLPEEIDSLAKKIHQILDSHHINDYRINSTEYVETGYGYDFETNNYHEDLPTPRKNFALQVTETYTHGCPEDQSERQEKKQRIVLLPADEDAIGEFEANMYSGQDYSYHVSIQQIGILDLPGESLECNHKGGPETIVVRNYPEASIEMLQDYADIYDDEQPVILCTGPILVKNLHSKACIAKHC